MKYSLDAIYRTATALLDAKRQSEGIEPTLGLTSVTVRAGVVWPALPHPTDQEVLVPIHLDMINMIAFYPRVEQKRGVDGMRKHRATAQLTRRAILYAGAYMERRCGSLKDPMD